MHKIEAGFQKDEVWKVKVRKIWILLLLYVDVLLFFLCFPVGKGVQQAEQVNLEEKKKIALTFDDGPHEIYTPQLLDGLKQRGVKATFFLIGENVEKNTEIVRRMYQEGHCIGSHTYHHVQLTTLSDEKACEEVEMTNDVISKITGAQVVYIRPPYGSWNDKLECAIPMKPVLWTIDPMDWSVLNTSSVLKHVKKNAKADGIILLHDIYPTSVQAALKIVDELQKDGYEFVTVDEIPKLNHFYGK